MEPVKRLKDFSLPMDSNAIKRCIPQRYPFLFVDRVVEFVPGERIQAMKLVSQSEPVLEGHFPGNPVFPGVLMIEAAAQTAGVFGHLSSNSGCEDMYLTEVTKTRFRKQVAPGDAVRFDVKLAKRRDPFFWFDAEAFVGEALVAQMSFSAFMK